ncbi:MAG: 30S ribosomal protein S1 [Candidatus Curtissbacteria bacterium GW2011_GWA1_40_16]|uniref:30S ribosomal protein S1 n=1 Tax=Candidatus Curtissbacteria bacterium GW2011_GWA1_40_16 TaxID=1618405 RepID=A0A0G0RE58_9BACT|nr:MAG: 30S ribosomal protein S1 [Candidatus Curtissbacteria bacterium GW2011_GWA1_40_16]
MVSQKFRDKQLQSNTDKKSQLTSSFAELFESSQKKVTSLRRNQEVVGRVISVSPQEVLIDIGAKSEGIVLGRELSAVSELVSKLSAGDSVEATVLYPENDAGQVVLSLRKLSGEKRWVELEEKKDNSEDIEVVALEVNRGGVICDYLGIHGFLPASQLTQSSGSGQAKEPAKLTDLIGRTLTARVIEVDRGSNRLILSQKQPNKKDLEAILALLAKVKIGDKVSGVISAVLPFGIFVEIDTDKVSQVSKVTNVSKGDDQEGGDESSKSSKPSKLEGLVHISELSWEKIEEPAKFFKVGDKVDVVVIAKDEATGRLNLSLKQLQDDPFAKVSAQYTKDLEVNGIVAKVTPFGVFVSLDGGIEGLIHISKIPPNVNFEVGQKVECSVEAVDLRSRRISLVPVVREKPVLYR